MKVLLFLLGFFAWSQVVSCQECDVKDSYQELRKFFDKQVKQKKYNYAQWCMEKALRSSKHRNNMDILELNIRSLIWQQKFNQAFFRLKKWKRRNASYYLVLGDLFWAKEYFEKARSAYEMAQVLKSESLSPVYLNKLIVSLLRSGEEEVARQKLEQSIAKFPNDLNLLQLRSLFKKVKSITISAEFRYYAESQSQSLEEEEVEALRRIETWRYAMGVTRSRKDFSSVRFSDYSLNLKTGKVLGSHDVELQYKHVFSPDFYYEYLIGGLYSFSLWKKWVLNADYQFRKYRDESLHIIKIGAEYYYRSFLFSLTVTNELKSFLLKARYYFKDNFFNELWWSAGKTESSRPYLVDSEEVSFDSVGYKLSYKIRKYLSAMLYFERHLQQAYDYNLFGVGVGYSF